MATTYDSVEDLADALRRTAEAHGKHRSERARRGGQAEICRRRHLDDRVFYP